MIPLYIFSGLFFLWIGGEALVRGAVALGLKLNLPALFVGMIIVGFGTSMPELMVSVDAIVRNTSSLAVGNIIGSNIANILLILAVAAVIRPIPGRQKPFTPDTIVLIAVSICVIFLGGAQEILPRWQGAAMLIVLIIIVTTGYFRAQSQESPNPTDDPSQQIPEGLPSRPVTIALFLLVGIAGLVIGAETLVHGGILLAKIIGVSDGVIGLTIVAIGTALPELASSVIASFRRQSEVAYGNIFGSNIFNLLGILGVTTLSGSVIFPVSMVQFDGAVMILATLAMLYFLSSAKGIGRSRASVMLAAYAAYICIHYFYITN